MKSAVRYRLMLTICLGILFCLSLSAVAFAELTAMVSISPQKYFVDKVAGGLIKVQVLVPAGANSHTYEPKPRQMAAMAQAKLYFSLGLEFEEAWLHKFQDANPDLIVVHTDQNVPKAAMAGRESGDHEEHGDHDHHKADKEHDHAANTQHKEHDDHEHDDHDHHGGLDPHIWLSPRLAAIQAKAIRDGLVKADPANQKAYDENLAAFLAEINSLDRELAQALSGLGGYNKLLVFHPAWGYFCRDYGLEQVAIEKEGKEPTAKGLASLINQAKREEAKVIFVQPQFSTRAAQTVAEAIGGRVVAIDPLAVDWADNLRRVAAEVKKALAKP